MSGLGTVSGPVGAKACHKTTLKTRIAAQRRFAEPESLEIDRPKSRSSDPSFGQVQDFIGYQAVMNERAFAGSSSSSTPDCPNVSRSLTWFSSPVRCFGSPSPVSYRNSSNDLADDNHLLVSPGCRKLPQSSPLATMPVQLTPAHVFD